MNRFKVAIAISLAMLASTAFGKVTDCFNPYHVRVVNQSGGEAELKRSRNISGWRKGINNAIKNYNSKDIVVENLGASLTVEHGPEDKEKTDSLKFYEKTGAVPMVILKGTSIETRGFNTQRGPQYNVVIKNESGGKAKIVGSCEAAVRGDIDNKSSRDVKVRSGSTITISMGPKGNKKEYKIRFSTPTEGGKPTIRLQQGGWFRPAITGSDVRFGAGRVNGFNQPVKLGPKGDEPKVKSGACGKSKKADMHG